MPTDSPSQGQQRRPFHRGRRGHDRRGSERRGPQPQVQAQEQGARGDSVDVEQIMREIRSRVAQRHGIELTDGQIQDLAARRLESILDPRTMKPSLLDQLRRNAGARPETSPAENLEPPYRFEDTTLYESPNGFLRFMRKLLAPVLKLFFNPNPLIKALHVQSRLNVEAARREAERDARQAEWNALHYDLLKRLVGEISKVSLEIRTLELRVESLAAKVDFNDRRVRAVEGAMHQARPSGGRERDRDREQRQREAEREQASQPAAAGAEPAAVPAAAPADVQASDAPRRRRRRRRGRRGAGAAEPLAAGAAPGAAMENGVLENGLEAEDVEEGEELETDESAAGDAGQAEAGPETAPAPERVTPQLEVPEPQARETAAPDLPEPTVPGPPPPEPERHEPQ